MRLGLRLLAMSVLSVIALGVITPSSSARVLVGTYLTPNCEQAPIWRIAYRLFWHNSRGMTIPTSDLPSVVGNAQRFVAEVGELSDCGVRVSLDVFDEGATVFHGSYDPFVLPLDRGEFAPSHYDFAFYRAPDNVDDGIGITDNHNAYFPVHTNKTTYWGLLMHEWLHGVVNFYAYIQQGWPRDDVHGGCYRPDYIERNPGFHCMVLPSWFADLMTGRVLEDGAMKGILPHEWAFFGTPLNRLNEPAIDKPLRRVQPQLSLRYAGGHSTGRVILTAGRILVKRTARVFVLRQRRRCWNQYYPSVGQSRRLCQWRKIGKYRSRTILLRRLQTIRVRVPRRQLRIVITAKTRQFKSETHRFATARAKILVKQKER